MTSAGAETREAAEHFLCPWTTSRVVPRSRFPRSRNRNLTRHFGDHHCCHLGLQFHRHLKEKLYHFGCRLELKRVRNDKNSTQNAVPDQ